MVRPRSRPPGNRSGTALQREVNRSPAYRRARILVLERDGYVCQIASPQCTRQATEVDHIVRPADGGLWADPANLRAACQQCNAGRARRTNTWNGRHSRIIILRAAHVGVSPTALTEAVRHHPAANRALTLDAHAIAATLTPGKPLAALPLARHLWRLALREVRDGNTGPAPVILIAWPTGLNDVPPPAHQVIDVT